MVVRKVEQFEFRVGGKVVWSLANTATGIQGSFSVSNSPTLQHPMISEGVRRVVGEYGEVLRKLSDK